MLIRPLRQIVNRQTALLKFRERFLKQQREYQALLQRGPAIFKSKHTVGWNPHTEIKNRSR